MVARVRKRAKAGYMISAVAELYKLHPQTLRLYERVGLLTPSRSQGNTRLQWEDSGRVRVTLGSGLRTDSCPATEISDSATPPDGVWSKEGDRTPTLDVLITRIIPARFAHCQQTIAKIRRIQSRVSPDECYAMMISKLCFTPVHDGGRVDFAYRNGPACRISLR